jgi:hypothetical protein
MPDGTYFLEHMKTATTPTVWCKTHPAKTVGKDKSGNYFKQCYEGFKQLQRGEKSTCKIIREEVKIYDKRKEK